MTFATYPSLAGRVVFVSGGATGIGAEIVRAFARNECRIAFIDIDEAAGERLARELSDGGPEVAFMRADVTDIAALRQSIADTRARLGPVAVLVNNAANDERQAVDAVDVATWDHAQNVNLRHHFFAAQAVHPHMRELGHGSIITLPPLPGATACPTWRPMRRRRPASSG